MRDKTHITKNLTDMNNSKYLHIPIQYTFSETKSEVERHLSMLKNEYPKRDWIIEDCEYSPWAPVEGWVVCEKIID